MLDLGRKGFPPEKLGRAIHRALTASKPKTRYTVTPTPFQSSSANTLPARLVDRMIAKQLGLRCEGIDICRHVFVYTYLYVHDTVRRVMCQSVLRLGDNQGQEIEP